MPSRPRSRPFARNHRPRLPVAAPTLLAILASALALVAPVSVAAQDVQARPSDVESLDGILGAVYAAISGPAGEERDWDRFRSLFTDGARLIPAGPRPEGGFGHRVMTVEDFVTQAAANMRDNGFFEREIHRTVERYGPVVHAFSTYESRRRAEDPEPFARGINSFQLLHDGSRWWVVTIFWHGETPDTPIPSRYLGGEG